MLRNPNTIPATDTIIEDAVMEPFFITNSQSGGYTVYERVSRGKDDKQYLRTVAYPSSFGSALRIVAREKLHSGDSKNYTSIKEYMTRWTNITDSIKEAVAI